MRPPKRPPNRALLEPFREELCEWEKLLAAWWPSGDPEEPMLGGTKWTPSGLAVHLNIFSSVNI